ncbi:kelch repeat-containing protein [soil metagenome]
MSRSILVMVIMLSPVLSASAHFVFVVPSKDGKTVQVVMSETLTVDEDVTVDKLAGLKLTARDASGKDTPLTLKADKHTMAAPLEKLKPRLVFGSVPYDVMKRGDAKPFLLQYHAKAVWHGGDAEAATLGKTAALEIVPTMTNGQPALIVLAEGEPVADVEVNLVSSTGEKSKTKTGKDGVTPEFKLKGLSGAWTKRNETKAGEHDGKKYDEIRHYATLSWTSTASDGPPLPKGVSSFGAVATSGYAYVYGGHSGLRHGYDNTTALGTFHRLKLDGGTKWEALPGGPAMQGLALAEHKGSIIRVGGMTPKNAPGDKQDLLSVADCARYDIATQKWTPLSAMPTIRSSHDAWVIGDKLYVVGGWQMNGRDAESTWCDNALELDLRNPNAKWKTIPQPFERRALTSAPLGTKLYVIAGLDDVGNTHATVNILDTLTGNWSTGPDLPGKNVGFSPAATTVNDRIVVSSLDGAVHRLSTDGKTWEPIGTTVSRRMVHRLVPHGQNVLLLGGGGRDGNFAEIEIVTAK